MNTRDVVNFIAESEFENLPSNVIGQAKVAIRDTLGVALGAHSDKAVEATRRVALGMRGREESTLFGLGVKVPCNIGAWVNSIMASTLDMDDGARGLTGHKGHMGGIVIPSALAVAERQNATGKDFIKAVVVGYEVGLRAGWIIATMLKTPLASGTPGAYGAAAAAASLLALKSSDAINALGIAEAHYPWHRSETYYPVSMTKENAGWGSMTGVTAALLALQGFDGRRTIFDLSNHSTGPLESLGKEWEIMTLYFKPYSACRTCHASIDGVLKLAEEHKLSLDNISKILVSVSSSRIAQNMANCRPATIWQAQYSMPFTIGAALVDGEVGPEQITEGRLGDQAILNVADKVSLVLDPEVEPIPSRFSQGRVKIEMKNGKILETRVDCAKGSPENPLTEDELRNKFRKLTALSLGDGETVELLKCLDRVEELECISDLTQILGHFA